ncbi:hypothetical protein DRW03_15705 [Corallococcus sp. H22C18031201]|nr:hypothetical protein DRW03_15705 [Corallococcus sp. H22C18031201]
MKSPAAGHRRTGGASAFMSVMSLPHPIAAVLAERERLHAVLPMLPVGVHLVDAQGGLLEQNDAASRIWGAPAPRIERVEDYERFEGYWPDTGKRLSGDEWALARTLRTGEAILNEEVDIIAFDGVRRTVLHSTSPLRAQDGALSGAVCILVDITARKVAERAEAFLSASSRLLAESLEWETTLKAVARLATREWADYCMVDMLGDDGALHRLALTARDPSRQALLDEALPFPPLVGAGTPLARAFTEGRPALVAEIDGAWMNSQARSEEHRRVLEDLAPRSAMLLPLAVGERRFGLINLASASPARRYTEQDLAYAAEFARRAALAVESARLYREARLALRDRDASLAMLESFLAASPMGMGFVDRELRYLRINPMLAEFNGVSMEAHLGRTVPQVLGSARTTPVEPLLQHVLQTQEPLVDQPLMRQDGREPRHFLGTFFPVTTGAELLGVGATVMEVTDKKRVEERLRFLAEATTRLSTSLDWRTTLHTVARLVVEQLADYCLVDVINDDGQRLERVERLAKDPAYQSLLEQTLAFAAPPGSRSPVRRALETGQSQLIARMDDSWMEQLAVSPEHRRLLDQLTPCSIMVVPLVARGRTLGVLSAVSNEAGRAFAPGDLAFLEDLAQRAALAVDNARLYRKVEQAVAARDEFVAIATHELRTPLSALHLQLTSLQRSLDRPTPDLPERLEQGLAGALRQADRLTRLVAHLFDVARISAGRMELETDAVELTTLVHQLVARMEEALAVAGCAAVVHANTPVVARADRPRVEQVLMNLLSNAMKYASGLPVELSVECDHDVAIVAVRDWGSGIPPAARQRIFERFARASTEHARASLGLGLYISRQIARAHGGELDVEDAPDGPGARFVLRLPLWKKPALE